VIRDLLRQPVVVPLAIVPMIAIGGALESVAQGLGLTVFAGTWLITSLWMRSNPLWVRDSFWRKHPGLRNWLTNPFPWSRPIDLPGEQQERKRATLRAAYCAALVIVGIVLLTRTLI
jgi:hypothetical protein